MKNINKQKLGFLKVSDFFFKNIFFYKKNLDPFGGIGSGEVSAEKLLSVI